MIENEMNNRYIYISSFIVAVYITKLLNASEVIKNLIPIFVVVVVFVFDVVVGV